MKFSSVYYQCGICFKKDPVRLVTLVDTEKLLALKLIRNTNKYIQLPHEPTYACVPCFKKLHVFKICIRRILLRKINGKMQRPNTPLNEDHVEAQAEEENAALEDRHDYTCQCDSCQRKYGSLPLLLQVIEQKARTETAERRTDFQPQPQPSTSSSQETEHRTSKKVLICQYCKKNFTHKGDYNKHLRTHTKEQPYTCQLCKRKFAHTSNLQRHSLLHSGHKPFVCQNCDKGFSRKDKLESHMRSKCCKKAKD